MSALELQVDQIVWYESNFIHITHIDYNGISIVLSYDILDDSVFHNIIGWDFYYIPKEDLQLDLFE